MAWYKKLVKILGGIQDWFAKLFIGFPVNLITHLSGFRGTPRMDMSRDINQSWDHLRKVLFNLFVYKRVNWNQAR